MYRRAGKGRFHSGAVGLQRFERRRRHLERRRVSLDGGEQFAHPRSELGRHLTERRQHIFFPRRLCPFVGEDVTGCAVGGAQPDDVLTAKRRNRSPAEPPHRPSERTRLAQHRRSIVHPPAGSSMAAFFGCVVGDKAQERRLLKLRR
jgi:hypothetical protein